MERSARLLGPLPSLALWGLLLCLPDSTQYLTSFLGSPCWNCLLPAWASCPGPQEISKSLRITPETRDTPTRLSRDLTGPVTYSSGPAGEGLFLLEGKMKFSELKFSVLEIEVLAVWREENLGVQEERRGSYTG